MDKPDRDCSVIRTALLLLVLVLMVAGGAVSAGGDAASGGKGQDYNVVIILNDALCANHLACYGYHRNTSRNVDRLAREGTLFENCLSQAWYTLPSHASLFTSKYVHSHHVTKNNTRLAEGETTLAKVLKGKGYKTAAFTGGIFLEPVYGLDQGFDTYYSSTAERTAQHPELFPLRLGKSGFIIPKAIKWIEANRKEKFFIFVHFYDLFMPARLPAEIRNIYDPHYHGPADGLLSMRQIHLQRTSRSTFFLGKKKSRWLKEVKLEKKDLEHLVANYDAAIFQSDRMIGALLDKLNSLDLTKKTLIIFTSDHGTDLMGHGTMHLYMDGSVYDEVLHVPLIIKGPQLAQKAARNKAQVQLIDVMPTILDYLKIPQNAGVEGRSLLPLMQGGPAREAGSFRCGGGDTVQTGRGDGWKLLYSLGKFELYNLRDDPGELRNRALEEPGVFLGLVKRLLSWNSEVKAGDGEKRITLSRELIEKLRKAGYW